MNALKKIIGLTCIIVGLVAEYFLITAIINGSLVKNPEENMIFALTVIPVSIPVLLGGLLLFGYFALKGEYDANEAKS
jgi:ABC-type transport system involved in cytochrome c biogenesis permease component